MSTISTTLSASHARSHFYTILEEVTKKLRRFVITRKGETQAIIMHPEEVASWEETMEILADKKLVAQILRSESERKAGKVISEKKLLRELKVSPKDLK